MTVGNRLYFSKKWKTFPDFLQDYIKLVLDKEWWQAEFAKPAAERHEIIRWCVHHCEFQKKHIDEIVRGAGIVPDGVTKAYSLLCYDLYILEHHRKLQGLVVNRLKQGGQFQGARYELFVAATLIRAGFQVRFEDETDSTTKHPELIAYHKQMDLTIAVEAKSRHRPGVLGHQGELQEQEDLKLGLHRLLSRASQKTGIHPLIVFVDINLPPNMISPLNESSWLGEIRLEIENAFAKSRELWPYALAVVTNHPFHYGNFNDPEPISMNYISMPGCDGNPLVDPRVADVIEKSLRQFGAIPQHFPDY